MTMPAGDGWKRWRDQLADACANPTDRDQMSRRLALALRELWPASEWTGCRLVEAGAEWWAIVDQAGAKPHDALQLCQTMLARAPLEPPGRMPLAEGGFLFVAALRRGEELLGHLLVRQSEDPGPFMTVCADTLSLELALVREKTLRVEAETWAIVGVAADGLLHELGNILHRCVLQAAILERRAPEELRDDVQILRTEGAAAARLLAPLQRRREERRQQQESAGLNDCLREAMTEVGPSASDTRVSLAHDLPPIDCPGHDLRRLLRLLLTPLLETGVAPDAQVSLCTQRTPEGQAQLLVQTASPPWRDEVLKQPFDAPDGPFGPPTALTVLALHRLLRSTKAVLELSNQPTPATVAVTWA